jgi:hypothetical protein
LKGIHFIVSGDIDPAPSYDASGVIVMGACHQFVRTASFSPHVCAFELRCHRSELSTASLRPNWHFQKATTTLPLKTRSSRVASRAPDYFLTFNLLPLRRQGRGYGVGRGRGVGVGLIVAVGVGDGGGVIVAVAVAVALGVGVGLACGQLKISIDATGTPVTS